MRTAYQDRMRDLLDIRAALTEHEKALLLRVYGLAPSDRRPPEKRVPYDDLYLWQRQNYWTGGLGE